MNRPSYKVRAFRSGGWWALIADAGGREVASQATRLDQAGEMIRDAIAIALDVRDDAFAVEIYPELPLEFDNLVGTAQDLRAQYMSLGAELSHATAKAVKKLRARGLSVRDVAYLLHLTPGRVSQIEHGY